MCVDIKPVLTRSSNKFADFYPNTIIQHDVSTQDDMFLACSSPKEAKLTENEEDSRDATVTTVSTCKLVILRLSLILEHNRLLILISMIQLRLVL